jgi:nuclear protein localization family protein 4
MKKICSNHPPWPEGVCTECKPPDCRVTGQPYRHVDHVEFESSQIIEQFMQFWRESGHQRGGYLYGKYIQEDHIPLGIRATVSAIFEPSQTATEKGFTFSNDLESQLHRMDSFMASLGLRRIGWIWTDLQVDKQRKLIVSRQTPLLGHEVIAMAKYQNLFPAPCRQSETGKFGSKWVSIVLTGNENGGAEPHAYQVSNQCSAIVKEKLVGAAKDPQFLRVKKRSTKRYTPEITYVTKTGLIQNEQNIPLEFFVIPLRHGFLKKPKLTFSLNKFPVENRPSTKSAIAQFFRGVPLDASVSELLNDFHFLVFLISIIENPEQVTMISNARKNVNLHPQIDLLLKQLLKPFRSPSPPPNGATNAHPKNVQNENILAQIIGMGFTRSQAETAMKATDGTIDAAVALLLATT